MIRQTWFWTLLLSLSLWTLTPHQALSTIVLEIPLEELATASNFVVYGEVTSVKSAWHEQGRSRVIITEVTLSVERAIKMPQQSETITFWTLGGRVDDLVQKVSGEPSFKPGDRVLVFLEERAPGEPPWVMGMAQGAFHTLTASDGSLLAVQDTSHLALAEIQSRWDPTTQQLKQNVAMKEDLSPPQIRPLPDLLDEVERLTLAPKTQSTP